MPQGIEPLIANQITTEQAFDKASVPMKKFMLGHVREADLKLFMNMAGTEKPQTPEACRSPRWRPPSCSRS